MKRIIEKPKLKIKYRIRFFLFLVDYKGFNSLLNLEMSFGPLHDMNEYCSRFEMAFQYKIDFNKFNLETGIPLTPGIFLNLSF